MSDEWVEEWEMVEEIGEEAFAELYGDPPYPDIDGEEVCEPIVVGNWRFTWQGQAEAWICEVRKA